MLANGKGLVSEQLSIVLLCRKMHWSYDTYCSQPGWFLDLMRIADNTEAEFEQRVARAMERKRSRK